MRWASEVAKPVAGNGTRTFGHRSVRNVPITVPPRSDSLVAAYWDRFVDTWEYNYQPIDLDLTAKPLMA